MLLHTPSVLNVTRVQGTGRILQAGTAVWRELHTTKSLSHVLVEYITDPAPQSSLGSLLSNQRLTVRRVPFLAAAQCAAAVLGAAKKSGGRGRSANASAGSFASFSMRYALESQRTEIVRSRSVVKFTSQRVGSVTPSKVTKSPNRSSTVTRARFCRAARMSAPPDICEVIDPVVSPLSAFTPSEADSVTL